MEYVNGVDKSNSKIERLYSHPTNHRFVDKPVKGSQIKCGKTLSCGCLGRERRTSSRTTHGSTRNYNKSSEYNAWVVMRDRCHNPNNKNYHNYGGRGIKVCERWDDFSNFINDLGEKPSKKHSLDRIVNDGGYEPSNCRWATLEQQANNKRSTVMIKFRGEIKSMAQWEKELGLKKGILAANKHNGVSIEKYLNDRYA